MKPSAAEIQAIITEIMQDMTKAWDLEPDSFGPETQVVSDLGFSSVDIIHLIASIEMRFHQKLPYDEIIMVNGRYVDDLSMRELVTFVTQHLHGVAANS